LRHKHVFKVHPYCSMCQNSLSFKGWIIFHGVYTPHFIHLLTCWWTLKMFLPFGYCE
jgi:hypothetical protein